jgi:hypothetical protein
VETTFQVTQEVTISLDSVTAIRGIKSLQFLPGCSTDQVSFLNTLTNTFYIYEYSSGKLVRTISFQQEGPNGVGNATSAFLLSHDSILVQNFNRNLAIVNFSGDKIYEFDLMPSMDESRQFQDTFQSVPQEMDFENYPVFRNGKLFLSGNIGEGWGHDISEAGTRITVDLKNTEKKYSSPYPKVYTEVKWPGSFRDVFRAFNSQKNTFVYSFPADTMLYEVDMAGKLVASYPAAGINSTKINKWPYSEPVNTPNLGKKIEHYFTSNSFGFVLYDATNYRYYRLKYIPKKDLDLDNPGFDTNVLVFYGSFNLIKELQIDANEEYGILEMAFSSMRGGITTYRKQENEDLMELVRLDF